jgi:hypothetical protein
LQVFSLPAETERVIKLSKPKRAFGFLKIKERKIYEIEAEK